MPLLGISDYLNQLYLVQVSYLGPCQELFPIRNPPFDFRLHLGLHFRHRSSVTHISHLKSHISHLTSLFAIEDLTLIFVEV